METAGSVGPGSRERQEAGTGLTFQGPPLVIYFLHPGFTAFKTVSPAGNQALNQEPQGHTSHSTPNKGLAEMPPGPWLASTPEGDSEYTGARKESQGDTWGGTSTAKDSKSYPTLAEVEPSVAPSRSSWP